MKTQKKNSTQALAFCALLAAISILMARVLSFAQPGSVRFSLDKFPLFLAGLLFGPVYGILTGFVADALGSMLQFGFNPIFAPPAIFYGLCGGLFRYFIAKKPSWLRFILGYLPPVVLGSVLYQSAALAFTYNAATFWLALQANLISRSIQFAITLVLETGALYLLIKTKLFDRMGIWPPKRKKEGAYHDRRTSH